MRLKDLLMKRNAEGEGGRIGPAGPELITMAAVGLIIVLLGAILLVAKNPAPEEDTCSCRCREAVREEAAAHLRQALEAWEREPAEAAERAREAERIRRMAEQIRRERTELIKAGAAVRAGERATEEGDAVAEPAAEVDR